MKIILLCVVSFVLVSCHTTKHVPYTKSSFFSVSDARVYIFRDDDALLLKEPKVIINNRVVGVLPNRTVTKYIIPKGEYIVRLDWKFEENLYIQLEAGKTYFIKPWVKKYDEQDKRLLTQKDIQTGFEVLPEHEGEAILAEFTTIQSIF